MNHPHAFAFAAVLSIGPLIANASLIDIDFNVRETSIQTGWRSSGWPSGNTPGPVAFTYDGLDATLTSSGTPGSLVLTVSAGATPGSGSNMLSRDRESPTQDTGFALADVYRDILIGSANLPLWYELSGLSPASAYRVTFRAYDATTISTNTFYDATDLSSTGVCARIGSPAGYVFSADTPADVFSAVLEVISDANGLLRFCELPRASKQPIVNGFSVEASAAAPRLDLAFDFGSTLDANQAGFRPFCIPQGNRNGPFTTTCRQVPTASGAVTLSVAAGDAADATAQMNSRDRATNGFPTDLPNIPGDTLRDFVNPAANNPIWISLAGLDPGAKYEVTVWAYDHSNSKTITIADFTSGSAGKSAQIAIVKATDFSAAAEDVQTAVLVLQANASGALVLKETSSSGTPVLNGFRVRATPGSATVVVFR